MTQIPKIVALVAFLMAAGCADSYPVQEPPLDVLTYPVGLTVRQVAPTASAPAGSSQLVIVNSNFDLRFSETSGGTVLVVDPERSQDSALGGELAVLGSARIGSFGGEVALADAACQPGWPDCPSQCAPLALDPLIGGGGAKLLVASRSGQTIYRMDMASDGSLQCGASCPLVVPIQHLDPYGISIACSDKGGAPSAYAFVSHLLSANNLGWLSRVNLLAENDVLGLMLGQDSTYTTVYDKARDRVFVSTSAGLVNATFRWFNPLVTPTELNGYAVPNFSAAPFSSFLPGATARDMALSSDGRFLYVNVQIFDLTIALQTGAIFTQGGALAIFDLTPTALAQPSMALLGVVRTCLGAGQIRRLPARSGKADLFAITCDLEGALAIYDSDAHTVVRYIGLDPVTGLPVLGNRPFGLAVEPIDPARAIVPVPGEGYEASPCVLGRDCNRIYVGSFYDNWVNVLEMDPDQPNQVALVKRIGEGPLKARLLLAVTVLFLAACSKGSAVVLAGFRGPVAVVPFTGMNPDRPEAGLVPLIAVASFRGNELRLIDPAVDAPVAGPNVAFALALPTMPRPVYLASGSLQDGQADLLVVASSGEQLQLVGTWLDGTQGFGVVATWDLTAVAGVGAQVLSLAVAAVPSGPATGVPAVAPTTPGVAWVLIGFSDPNDVFGGQLVVLEVARQPDGSIALAGPAVVKPLGFAPVAMAVAPDNVHVYFASRDVIRDSTGSAVLGVAELDASSGLAATWPVRGLDTRSAPTYTVAAAFVGERTQANFYTFEAPVLRVYASLDPSGCGPDRGIACGVATIDPALGGLALDPAPPGPPGSTVPTQSYRTPLFVPSQPIAMGIALPPTVPGPIAPGAANGSQVCFSPAVPGNTLPLCPSIPLGTSGTPPFNGNGSAQPFMLEAPTIGPLWTSVTALVTAIDGLAYVQDLGRFGPVNATLMVNSPLTQTSAFNAAAFGPLGPTANSPFLGFPDGTAAIGLWQDYPASGAPTVVYDTVGLPSTIIVWPGFTSTDHWRVSYQGVLPGLVQRRSVLGLAPGGVLYLAIQDALVPAIGGQLPANSEWVTGAVIASPELGVHALDTHGAPADLGLFLLDADPCTATRPNWIPAGKTTPVYDPTQQPKPHEAVLAALLPPDPVLYPGGGLLLAPAADPALASEYACLVAWFESPGNAGKVLTGFNNNPTSTDYARGTTLRAGGFVLIGNLAGYAGRPQLDRRYDLAWSDETGLSGEALVLARKARRFYYPAANAATPPFAGFPEMTDPMQPGPALGLRVGRYCQTGVVGCDPLTSPPARDAGVDFFTRNGLEPMSRHPYNTSGGNAVTSFDKSVIPGLEFKGRVFYSTYVGDALMMVPPGLDVTQTFTIR